MSIENVKQFHAKLAADTGIQQKLQAATIAAAEQAAVALAGTLGFDFNVEELRAVAAEKAAELSEQDLGNVAGGDGSVRFSGGTALGGRYGEKGKAIPGSGGLPVAFTSGSGSGDVRPI